MAILSFIFEQLFVLLVPELLVAVDFAVTAVTFNLPDKSKCVQTFLSIKPKFAIFLILPLRVNPKS
jgi:hypothetical protein